jgi:hypothetical protein
MAFIATEKMDQEVKAKWVEALRSGKYAQSFNLLQDGHGHCCLGVLCDLVDKDGWWVQDGGEIYTEIEHRTCRTFPHETVLSLSKLAPDAAAELARQNDAGLDFAEVADWIEKYL